MEGSGGGGGGGGRGGASKGGEGAGTGALDDHASVGLQADTISPKEIEGLRASVYECAVVDPNYQMVG